MGNASQTSMSDQTTIARVEAYFAAVDRKDLAASLSFFTSDATFTIATFQTTFRGRDTEIAGVFERLFSRYDTIYHGEFEHFVVSPERIASRFEVRNGRAGQPTVHKSNANFFRLKGELFQDVFVYMSGDNSLA
jgi:ketosteroid isomerase-like protein